MMTAFDLGICLGLLSTSYLHAKAGLAVTYFALFGCIFASALFFRFIVLPQYMKDLPQPNTEKR